MSTSSPQPVQRHWLYDFIKITASLPGCLWFRPKLLYAGSRERIRGGALLIANHIGFFDPVYLQFGVWYRRHHFVCLEEFFRGPARWFFRGCLCIPINKHNISVDSLREIVAHLKNGELVSMFPEGQVNDGSGEMASFKSGMVLMALRSGAPIVPVYIRRKEHWYERLVMAIGEPVDVKTLCGDLPGIAGIEAASEKLWEKEQELRRMIGGKRNADRIERDLA